MKTVKFTLSMIIMLFVLGPGQTFSQWSYNGTHIYNTNSGYVGIGSSSPSSLLYVGKNMTEPAITVQNLGGIGGATYTMMDNVSGANWKFKATNSGGFKIRDHAFALDVLTIEPNSLANALYINNLGNIGLGTNTPGYKLFIEGGDHYIHDYYPFVYLDNTYAGGNAGITIRQNGAYAAWIFYDDGEGLLRLNAEAGGGFRNDMVILSNGNVCLGTTNDAAGYRLSVNGKVACEEVLVELDANWPDYVFEQDYKLMTLNELEESIRANHRLPGLPSAGEVEENGFELADMQRRVVEKLEELTLYTIQQGSQIEALMAENAAQAERLQKLEKKLAKTQKIRNNQ